jgi:hypothetical protein
MPVKSTLNKAEEPKSVKRALTITDIERYKPKILEFYGNWLESIGKPELTGVWLIWGGSGEGKTYFAMQLAKYLTEFAKVCFNSLEEGLSSTIKRTVKTVNFGKKNDRFLLLDKEKMPDLITRLQRHKSPKVVIIDSLQYTGMLYSNVIALKEQFPHKLFIYTSHAESTEPKGNVAKSVRFEANVKIFIKDYQANIISRYGGGKPFVIWAKGYQERLTMSI